MLFTSDHAWLKDLFNGLEVRFRDFVGVRGSNEARRPPHRRRRVLVRSEPAVEVAKPVYLRRSVPAK